MSAEINLFTQYSDLRAAKRDELAAAGKSEAEIRDVLRYIVPALARPRDAELDASGMDKNLHADTRWDVPDSEGALPGPSEAEQAVMDRLAANHRAFHGLSEER